MNPKENQSSKQETGVLGVDWKTKFKFYYILRLKPPWDKVYEIHIRRKFFMGIPRLFSKGNSFSSG
jgi:hypothetical protein